MKSLFDKEVCEQMLQRIERLQPTSKGRWGKMNVAQMLAHCNETMKVVTDKIFLKRQLIGRILGPLVRKSYLSDKPLRKNSPTNPVFVIVDEREFVKEKELLKALVKEFFEGGEEKCTRQPHSFFGEFSPKEWGESTYKHLDHHLQQFGQ